MALHTIKNKQIVQRKKWYKIIEKQFCFLNQYNGRTHRTNYYVYSKSTNKGKQQCSTDKDTTSILKHSKPLKLKNISSEVVSFLSLYKHAANVAQYTHAGRKLISWEEVKKICVFSWDLKDDTGKLFWESPEVMISGRKSTSTTM